MRKFMDQDFLLSSETAKHLYHDYASKMPIIDYHCHLSPQEIYEDRTFETITQVWLGGDHYKWRIMSPHGVEEKYITGDGDDRTKFRKWAETVSMAIGNPLHHWSHLELRNYFDYQGVLNEDTADEVYDLCNEKLKTMSARKMIEMSHVTHLCTTDDPVDDLHWHRLIKADESFNVTVLPAWRPDKAMNIAADTYQDYIAKLSEVSGVEIHSYKELMEALKLRLEFFAENGCTVSDHGMENVAYVPASEEEIVAIFAKRMAGEKVSALEERKFRTAFLTDLGRDQRI